MTQKEKNFELRLGKLEQLYLQNAELSRKLSIIIEGDDGLGVEGLREKQRKDEYFKELVQQEFIKLRSEIDSRFDTMDKNFKVMDVDLVQLKDWKATWDKILFLMSNSKTWKVLFTIAIGLAAAAMTLKYKILDLLK
jgi:hypothetical protein